jgi:pimeloyl-ACP methyl ester carboxylesterase
LPAVVKTSYSHLIQGQHLVYSTSGDPQSPPLVMLHGWLSHRGIWQESMEKLQNEHYCIAIDLLGFGDSDKPAHVDYSIHGQAKRILDLLDAHNIQNFSLMGHSMGAQIAVYMASRLCSERVSRLINISGMVSGHLTPYAETVMYRLTALGHYFPPAYRLIRWFSSSRQLCCSKASAFRPWFYDMESLPFEAWDIDRRMAYQPGGRISAYRSGQAIHGLDLTPALPSISAPILTIFGQQDAIVPVSEGWLVKQQVPSSHLVLFEGCGHFPMYEKPAAFMDALNAFL